MQYAFGDSDRAAERLRLLAEAFSGSTRAFLQSAVTDPVPLVVDLGCGPGYCTHFLASVLPCERAVGLDNSEHFVALARRTSSSKVGFYQHDFTVAPFPTGPGDLLYARYELTHVQEPLAVLETWATQIRPGGLLLLEETEWIRTNCRPFSTYLATVEAMLRHQGNELYIGPRLHRMGDPPSAANNAARVPGTLRRRSSQVARFTVPAAEAARMFHLNILTWRSNPFIQANYPAAEIVRLERDLEQLTHHADGSLEIEWGLRQLVFERA